MNTEQKAKRYDEIINEIKNLRDILLENGVINENRVIYNNFNRIFPELKESKESEDEKVKEQVVYAINQLHVCECTKNKLLAYLEKQGEHSNFLSKIQIGDKVTRNEDGVLVNLSQLNRIAKKDEKQDKNNMGISEATKQKLEDNLNKALEKETSESCNKFLDEQGKKIDAIKNFNTEFEKQVSYLIASIINKDYEYTEGFVKWAADGLLNYAKHEIKKQSEQKETLCDKCKKTQPSHSCQDITALGRCAVEKVEPKFRNGQWIVWQDKYYKVNYNGCGYELVDQNGLSTSLEYGTVEESARVFAIQDAKDGDVLYSPTNRLIWIYRDNEHYHASINLNYADVISFDNEIVVPSDVCPANKVQRSILFQKMEESNYKWDAEKKELKKVECKPDWSEEDCNRISSIKYLLHELDNYNFDNWLNSLKDRYTWKPSDEQIETLRYACGGNYVNLGILESLYQDLKKLKEE